MFRGGENSPVTASLSMGILIFGTTNLDLEKSCLPFDQLIFIHPSHELLACLERSLDVTFNEIEDRIGITNGFVTLF